ncbi:ABC transporter ATP-binding protein [Cryobacterium sp. M91]|uniref:ABC transporter ATP-binding protein n=1 Tax=Cryobacterium sp. M91 TaxID=2048294 RepID=UPI000CE4F82B|nr:ABC transporter ATP-binding protein [Cryobacterium sp. M91]
MKEIVIDQVSKVFESKRSRTVALNDAALTIAPEEIVCVVGPSGCGKTSLLNLVAGFEMPTTGEIRVGGSRVRGPSQERAVVFQSDAVFPWLSVRDNIGFGLRAQGKSAVERNERVARFIELVGLSEFANSYPKELSGGMRKRVDIARAYASNPDILLLDEPFGALDHFTKEVMWLALRQVAAAEPKTILFITHDIEEALFLGDRVVVMTPRPARVHSIIDVPFGSNRGLELRADLEFQKMRLDIVRTLMEVNNGDLS